MQTLLGCRCYDRPNVQHDRLQKNVDSFKVGMISKLRSNSRNNMIIDFGHDCFRYLFNGKGRQSKDKKYILLEKDDFSRCVLGYNWDIVLDIIGDGVMVKYPIKVRPLLTKSPKRFNIVNGTLQEGRRMLIEILSFDFIRQPVKVPTVDG